MTTKNLDDYTRVLSNYKVIDITERDRLREMKKSPLNEDKVVAESIVRTLVEDVLKGLLLQCNAEEKDVFVRMYVHYCPGYPYKTVGYILPEEIVPHMPMDRMMWAIKQCENTLTKKIKV